MDDHRAGETATDKALAMLEAYASIGADAFDVTMLDIEGKKQSSRPNRCLAELQHSQLKH